MVNKRVEKTQYWLMKSEPSCYSIDDLKHDKKTMWDGVRNFQVINMMRDEMREGDMALFYHSNSSQIGVVGVMKIVRTAYPDPTQFDKNSEHPDPKSDQKNPRWFTVDVAFVEKLPRIVTLNEIKLDDSLKSMVVAKKGSRLSVTPVSESHFKKVIKLSNT